MIRETNKHKNSVEPQEVDKCVMMGQEDILEVKQMEKGDVREEMKVAEDMMEKVMVALEILREEEILELGEMGEEVMVAEDVV